MKARESTFLQTRLHFNPVGLDFVVERLAADAEAFGGFQLVAAGFLEHLYDGVAFDAFEQGEAGVTAAFAGFDPGTGDGKIGGYTPMPSRLKCFGAS